MTFFNSIRPILVRCIQVNFTFDRPALSPVFRLTKVTILHSIRSILVAILKVNFTFCPPHPFSCCPPCRWLFFTFYPTTFSPVVRLIKVNFFTILPALPPVFCLIKVTFYFLFDRLSPFSPPYLGDFFYFLSFPPFLLFWLIKVTFYFLFDCLPPFSPPYLSDFLYFLSFPPALLYSVLSKWLFTFYSTACPPGVRFIKEKFLLSIRPAFPL